MQNQKCGTNSILLSSNQSAVCGSITNKTQSKHKKFSMEKEFKLKLVNLRQSLEKGDLSTIAYRGGMSVVTVQQMFKTDKYGNMTPAMKRALDATINFVDEKKRINDRALKKIMGA